MSISIGKPSIRLDDILSETNEFNVLSYYLNIHSLPSIIHSPLRKDNNPSFGIYTNDGKKIRYVDFATKDSGGLFDLLMKMWGVSYDKMLEKLAKDLPYFPNTNTYINKGFSYNLIKKDLLHTSNTELQCKVRDWENYDLEYWYSFGISLEWLKYAEIYPISHKIIVKDGKKYIFKADKLAYAYVEHKDGRVTLKIYQPLNKNGYKWANKHDKSVISLWTKVPEYGDKICICSSMKDALCLWSNLKIPSIAIQGEGYNMSNTAISELKRRYKDVYILLDNDEVGLKNGLELSKSTGFTNLVLPQFDGGKDISDAYKVLGKEKWIELLKPLFYS